MICIPGPAAEGLKFPAPSTAVPLYTPVPVAPLVTDAVATLTVPLTLSQTAGNAGYANAGVTLKVLVTIESFVQPLAVMLNVMV